MEREKQERVVTYGTRQLGRGLWGEFYSHGFKGDIDLKKENKDS